ncbi:DNA primase family protein [Sphingomonas sp. Leaf257]|uniref:DNA primase family protein n=1 Tax=Sphingomonas sp. Leaf257 TaxID=1736309 RepID=UPI000701B631|nr:phage/plasmid primase, P4 family [Sphingomonas sp. Leaf257]KQO57682.1 DNA primase [Sphingomonas sp. Leaf257]
MSDAFIPMVVADPLKMAWLDTSDYGNATRLVAVVGGKLLWLEDLQIWAHYDGRRWAIERGNIEAQRLAHQTIQHIDIEAETLGAIADDAIKLKDRVGSWCTLEIAQERVKTLRTHAVRSGSAGSTAGMLKQARSMLTAVSTDFDTDPLVYNTMSHTLRFVKGENGKWSVKAKPHDPRDMLMMLANVEYDPAAKCPFWMERLAMLTPDPEQLASFQPLYGYTLTGLTSDQAFYVHQGKGGDGKSVTHMALGSLHGDYYRHASVATFLQGSTQKAGSEHRSDLVRLRGDIRFVTCDEPPPRSVWDGGVIKQITGSQVTARGANQTNEVTFKPRFKMHSECNIIPRAPADDKGFRRRFKLYQWSVSIEETPAGNMPIDLVLEQLEAERSGILNWLIEGALQWLTTRTIPQPTAMSEVLSDFWADSSPLGEWMSEWCDTADKTAVESAKALYDHFKAWCENNGREQVMSATAFGRALRDKHHGVKKDSKGVRWRKGIKLRREAYLPTSGAGDDPASAAASSLPPVAGAGGEPSVGLEDDDYAF